MTQSQPPAPSQWGQTSSSQHQWGQAAGNQAPGNQAPGNQTQAGQHWNAQPWTSQQWTPQQWNSQQWNAQQWQQQGPPTAPTPTTAPKRSRPAGLRLVALAVAALVAIATASWLATRVGGGSGDDGVSYQQENYRPPPPDTAPPPLPRPASSDEVEQYLKTNRVYDQELPNPIRCTLPTLDMSSASESQIKAQIDRLSACLMKLWDPALKAAGWTMVRPVANVYSTPSTGPCGKLPTRNAFYCGVNQQIYYATDLPMVMPENLRKSRFVVEMVIAHEIGHAVQFRTAIGYSTRIEQQSTDTKAGVLQLNRRLELQADCFAGMFLGTARQSMSMTQTDLDGIMGFLQYFGDDSRGRTGPGDHGTSANRQYWLQMGMASTKTSACNTYVAGDGVVG